MVYLPTLLVDLYIFFMVNVGKYTMDPMGMFVSLLCSPCYESSTSSWLRQVEDEKVKKDPFSDPMPQNVNLQNVFLASWFLKKSSKSQSRFFHAATPVPTQIPCRPCFRIKHGDNFWSH